MRPWVKEVWGYNSGVQVFEFSIDEFPDSILGTPPRLLRIFYLHKIRSLYMFSGPSSPLLCLTSLLVFITSTNLSAIFTLILSFCASGSNEGRQNKVHTKEADNHKSCFSWSLGRRLNTRCQRGCALSKLFFLMFGGVGSHVGFRCSTQLSASIIPWYSVCVSPCLLRTPVILD